jgi:hypothetical protein
LVPFYLSVSTGALPRTRLQAFVGLSIVITMAMVIVHVPLAFLAIPLAAAFWWISTEPAKRASVAETPHEYAFSPR